MDFIEEMKGAIHLNLDGFKAFVDAKLQAEPNYLNQFQWVSAKKQLTVLGALIYAHQEKDEVGAGFSRDLTAHINYVIAAAREKNLGQPLHLASAVKKIKLLTHLLRQDNLNKNFDVNQRDINGHTLLSLVLATKNADLLNMLLKRKVNVNEMSLSAKTRILVQPLHQAIQLNFTDGVKLLVENNAQLTNPLGRLHETPLLLAARLGRISAMEALLGASLARLGLDAINVQADGEQGNNAIEELCNRVKNNKNPKEALRGIAMLLCCGAEPPQKEEMRVLLRKNRVDLLKTIDEYLSDKPHLVDPFVQRCHLKESDLHTIVYADHSWGSSIRHLFGKPSNAALIIENLVVRKYSNPALPQGDAPVLSGNAAENMSAVKDPLKLYAEFVRRYTAAYESQKITNRWSTMRWMIAEGEADWETVVRYSRNHPTSRTRIIYQEMFQPLPSVHDDVEQVEAPAVALKN